MNIIEQIKVNNTSIDGYQGIYYSDSPEYVQVTTDSDGKILEGIKIDGSKHITGDLTVDGSIYSDSFNVEQIVEDIQERVDEVLEPVEETLSYFDSIENPEWLHIITDSSGKIISGIKTDGNIDFGIFPKQISDYVHEYCATQEELNEVSETVDKVKNVNIDPINRNVHQRSALTSACRISKFSRNSKDFLALIVTDNHAQNLPISNAVKIANNFFTIDCILYVGDIVGNNYDAAYVASVINILKNSNKPWLITPGNHDVGNATRIYYCATHEDVYNSFIKPMVDNNILVAGEYTEGKSYYYHDFTDRKIRVISIYEYDAPLDVGTTANEYWGEVTYDESYPKMEIGETYIYDESNPIILNCANYKGGSFKLKQTVTITPGSNGDNTIPKYVYGRMSRIIMQELAEWFADTLKNTPDEYGIIVLTHAPAMINSTSLDYSVSKFSANNTYTGGPGTAMITDLLADVVEAFINKEAKSIKVIMSNINNAELLNTQEEDGIYYAYKLNVDFTNRTNDNTYFACYVGGHVHIDLVYKHNTYTHQYSINPTCATDVPNERNDIARPWNTDDASYDVLTTISVSNGRIALARIGNDKTINGFNRDFEVINV